MGKLDCKRPDRCHPKEPEKEIYPPPTNPFTLCVGDYALHWDGTRATVERVRRTTDGTYTSITTVNGCIVDYGHAEEPTYTPPYCNPNPSPCQGGGEGGGTVVISPNKDNILSQVSNGLYARCYIQASNGIDIKGTGTLVNPYIISTSISNGSISTKYVVGRNGVVASTDTNGTTFVELEETGVKTGIYDITDQFAVDKFGRIVNVDARKDPILSPGKGLTSHMEGDTLVIEHEVQNIEDNLFFGGYNVRVNNTGHMVSTNRVINVNKGVYNLGAYDVGVNEYGSIYGIEQRTDILPENGTFITTDGKKISYDVTGRLVGVEKGTNGGGTQPNPNRLPLPIRDMCKLSTSRDDKGAVKLSVEVYGKIGTIRLDDIKRQITMDLPSYITSEDNIDVNGVASISGSKNYSVDFLTRKLVIDMVPTLATVVFRG